MSDENKKIDVMRIIRQHLTSKSLNGTLTNDYANGAIDSAVIITRLIDDKNKDKAETRFTGE